MRKLLLLLIIFLCYSSFSQAAAYLHADTVKKDTVKINKELRSLNADLAEYKADLATALNKVPVDSVALVTAISKSEDALSASKKAANNAVGGDLGDAKNAEKKAKKAADATDDANDAKERLESDRKTIKKLNKKIDKTQKKINDLQAQQ